MNIKKISILILSAFFVIFLNSCERFLKSETEDCDSPDYSDCDTREPYYTGLKIWVLEDEAYKLESVEVFLGNVEKGDLVKRIDTINTIENPIFVNVATDDFYSARAIYTNSQDTFICIDGTKIKKHSYTNCDSTCWYLTGDEIDLVLKN